MRPLSPIATLKNSIAAAELKLSDIGSKLKQNRKEHSKTLSNLRREVDTLKSRLATEYGDDRNYIRLNQLRQSTRMAEEATEMILVQVEAATAECDQQRETTNRVRQVYADAAKRRDDANDKLKSVKQETSKQLKDATGSLNSVSQKRERLTNRNVKLADQLTKIEEEEKAEAEKRLERQESFRHLEATERELMASIDKTERGCAEVSERLNNVLARVEAASRSPGEYGVIGSPPANTTDSTSRVPAGFSFPAFSPSNMFGGGAGRGHGRAIGGANIGNSTHLSSPPPPPLQPVPGNPDDDMPLSTLASLIDSSSPIADVNYESPGPIGSFPIPAMVSGGANGSGSGFPSNPIRPLSHTRAQSTFGNGVGVGGGSSSGAVNGSSGMNDPWPSFSRVPPSSADTPSVFGLIRPSHSAFSSLASAFAPTAPVRHGNHHHHRPSGHVHAHPSLGPGQSFMPAALDRTGSPARTETANVNPLPDRRYGLTFGVVGNGSNGNGHVNHGPIGPPPTSSSSLRRPESTFGPIGSGGQHGHGYGGHSLGFGIGNHVGMTHCGPPSGRASRAGTMEQHGGGHVLPGSTGLNRPESGSGSGPSVGSCAMLASASASAASPVSLGNVSGGSGGNIGSNGGGGVHGAVGSRKDHRQ